MNPYSNLTFQLPLEAINLISDTTKTPCCFIKKDQKYLLANSNFYKMFGLQNVLGKHDSYICRDKKLISIYLEYDDLVMQTEQPITINEIIAPTIYKNFTKNVICKKFPLYHNSDKSNAVLGILFPENKLLSLTPDDVLNLSIIELHALLVQNKYEVLINWVKYSFSKRELVCFFGLLKGKQAGEIAVALNLKQNTIESYIKNLKNKCGINRKSDLIDFFLSNRILQQIVI